MIRSLPFAAITAQHIEELREREVLEDHTLDYKLELKLEDRDARSELLKDIVAFANASGGTLLFGVKEGAGEQQGLIVDFPGLVLAPDAVQRTLDNLLRDSIDERIPSVLHRAVSRADGKYYYLIRVAPSPLAPHMVTLGVHRAKFFLRGNTTNDPMNARQIKEVAMKASSAAERANAFASDRSDALIAAGSRRIALDAEAGPFPTSQAILHAIPLFPRRSGWEFANDAIRERLGQVPAFGSNERYDAQRLSQEGLASEYSGVRHVKFLRNGAVEFQRFDVMRREARQNNHGVAAWEIEQSTIDALDECACLSRDGLLPMPVLISLTISGTNGSRLLPNPHASGNQRQIGEDVVRVTPILVTAWGPATDSDIRSLFDEMYQAWGFARSINYDAGARVWWSELDRIRAPERRFIVAAG